MNENDFLLQNAEGQVLIGNWQEDRIHCALNGDVKRSGKFMKIGHKGIISDRPSHKDDLLTTYNVDYVPKQVASDHNMGIRNRLLEMELINKITKEVEAEFHPSPGKTDYTSTTKKDFHHAGFTAKDKSIDLDKIASKKPIHLVREQPVTYWTEYRDRITGTTQLKTLDTPFRKNSAFSCPIENYLGQPKPYEMENYPKM